MARANLTISSELTDAFIAAQEISTDVRLLKVIISSETITLEKVVAKIGNANQDFDTLLKNEISDIAASMIIFRISDNSLSSRQWMLFVWIPDGCKVRDKMLYSSSREDLKKKLGLGYFTSEYSANDMSDVSWNQYINYSSNNKQSGPLSEREKLILEEKSLSNYESNKIKSSAMGILPFQMDANYPQHLLDFQQQQTNFIEFEVRQEEIHIVTSKLIDSIQGTLRDHIHATEARMIEIRSIEEVDEQLRADVDSSSSSSTNTTSSAPSSTAAVLTHTKPTRPGRGKAKVSVFRVEASDEDTQVSSPPDGLA